MGKDHEFWNFGKISGWHFREFPIGLCAYIYRVHPFKKKKFVALALLLYLAARSNSIAFTDETYYSNRYRAIGRWAVEIC